MAFDLTFYFNRIGLNGPFAPNLETLRTLHLAHLTTIPYENLDIIARLPFCLDDDALFEKIVLRRRGGFCYELNLLFARLLRELGYTVEVLSAQIVNEDGLYGPEFGHPVLMVTLEQRWLVDVGNARWFHLPLRMDDPTPQTQCGHTYHVERTEDHYILMQTASTGEDLPQYRFTLRPRQSADFYERCVYNWTSPESRFTRGYLCSRRTPRGRIVLRESRLIVEADGIRTERPLQDLSEYLAQLTEHFGSEYAALIKPR